MTKIKESDYIRLEGSGENEKKMVRLWGKGNKMR